MPKTLKEITTQIIALQKKLKEYNDLYYNQNISKISDAEYDEFFRILKKLENKYRDHLPEILTDQVGAKVISKTLNKVTRTLPMLSLENAMNEKELIEFIIKKNEDLNHFHKEFFFWVASYSDTMARRFTQIHSPLLKQFLSLKKLVFPSHEQDIFSPLLLLMGFV